MKYLELGENINNEWTIYLKKIVGPK